MRLHLSTKQVEQDALDTLRQAYAIEQHLHYNCSLPTSLTPTCQTIIRRYAAGDTERDVVLPKGMRYRGRRTVEFWDAVDFLHLESFLGACDYDLAPDDDDD